MTSKILEIEVEFGDMLEFRPNECRKRNRRDRRARASSRVMVMWKEGERRKLK